MSTPIKEDKPILSGELVWVVMHNFKFGWALYLFEGFEYLHNGGAIIKHLLFFKGKIIALERDEFRRFLWYNRHLLE